MFKLLLTCVLGTLFIAQDTSEPERLIRSLASDSAEVRQKAQDRLIEMGEKALPALRKASANSDPEVRSRVEAAIAEIDRLDRERQHDAEERATLLKKSGMAEARQKGDDYWQVAWTDGAAFRFGTRSWKDGVVLTTHITNYLAKSYAVGSSDLEFRIVGITDAGGKDLDVAQCGVCSPQYVYAKNTKGPINAHVQGSLRWWSPYILEFESPKDGDKKKVGDFNIQVAWPTLRITSGHPYPKDLFPRVSSAFSYEVKPGVQNQRRGALWDTMGVGVGGGGGGSRGGGGQGSQWCCCQEGPKPPVEPPKVEHASEYILKKERGPINPLEDIAKIKVWFYKPVMETIDFTQVVSPK